MRSVSKPGDVFVAKTIGTYPELPDTLDTPDLDPAYSRADDFADGVHSIRYTGPLGVVTVSLLSPAIEYTDGDGVVLLRTTWDPATSTWREESPRRPEQTSGGGS